MFYSVPFEYVHDDVDVRITDALIEVYFNEHRIASHRRLTGAIGQRSMHDDHMPEHHRRYLNHTPKQILAWAKTIGPHTTRYVEHILAQQVEKKALKWLATLRHIAAKETDQALEEACHTLMSVAKEPSNTLLKSLLARAKKQHASRNDHTAKPADHHQTDAQFGFARGAGYFGGKNNEK